MIPPNRTDYKKFFLNNLQLFENFSIISVSGNWNIRQSFRMKRSSTRSGPSCSGFWDTVRNNLTIREMTALMGGDGTME